MVTAIISKTATESTEPEKQGIEPNPDKKGKEIACLYLSGKGLEILERDWECGVDGVDIVAREGNDLAFIKVRTTASMTKGLPEDVISYKMRAKFEASALRYLATHEQPDSCVRFDVIAIVLLGEGQAFLRYHRDALSA